MLSLRNRRVFVTVLDQAVSSLSNFVTGLVIARLSGPAEFGRYMLILTVWLVVVGLNRSVVTDPLIVTSRNTDADRSVLAQGVSAELLLAAGASVLLAAAGVTALAVGEPIGVLMLALAPWFAPLLVQDYWRAMAFQLRRPGLALANDLVFAVVQFAAIWGVWALGWHSTSYVIGAWGLGATAGALVGFAWFPGIATLRRGGHLIARLWPLGRWMAGDYMTGFGSQQAYVAFVAFFLSQADYGGFRAAVSLMGPSVVIVHAAANIGLPEASRLATDRPAALGRFARHLTLATALCITLYGVLVAAWGSQLLDTLYGPEFARFSSLATLAAVQYVLMVSVFGQATVLKALGRVRALWRARLVVGLASLASTIVLVRWLGAIGAGWAGVATGVYFAIGVFVVYRQQLRLRRRDQSKTPGAEVDPVMPLLPS